MYWEKHVHALIKSSHSSYSETKLSSLSVKVIACFTLFDELNHCTTHTNELELNCHPTLCTTPALNIIDICLLRIMTMRTSHPTPKEKLDLLEH